MNLRGHLIAVGARAQHRKWHPLNQIQRWPREYALVRDDAQQIQSFALQTPPGEVGHIIDFGLQNFVQDHADDFHSFLLEERLVQGYFVNRLADAALADDDDFGLENLGDLRVRQIENRA